MMSEHAQQMMNARKEGKLEGMADVMPSPIKGLGWNLREKKIQCGILYFAASTPDKL